ncbi:glycoside hydrolase family 127 protein [uncultured Muribaculum sp.]|uniref:glycoside hydrolase family 127 protein n=1 Tax=uncultured Muribaculum sp. TaxID=1918613 RepID=UPI0025AFC24A|nr:glycoside hydrolase family 127 protein [uncultured Muribaculum sp.]
MRNIFVSAVLTCTVLSATAKKEPLSHGYPIEPVPFTSVKVADAFWGQRLEASRNTTIPLAFSKCEESGRYDNFVKATMPCDTFKVGGFPFDDTDVYKTIEGASYLLQTYPDKKLEAYIDSVLVLVAAAQEPDGYLNTSYTMNPSHPHAWMSPVKWERVERLSHEFYNLGHMVEGAVAHWRATGKRNFLDIAIRYADCVCREIGQGKWQVDRVPGHQIAEMALAKLYLVTGNESYLKQAKYFLDRRGYTTRKDEYSQAHKPVVEQDEAVGHAVRAVYMYSGMADVAALTGDSAYVAAINRIWDNIVNKKYYITGGIGARHNGEAFGNNYELPNHEAYCETCAAIGNVYMNHRLFLLHGDSKYYDVLERTLYNGLISGVSLDGGAFFYPNPLASNGGYSRKPWFGCACCPSNISRFIPSLPGYVYAVRDNDVYVNLFMGNDARLSVNGKCVDLSQSGNYVWDGKTRIEVRDNRAGEFALKIRIPGWVRNRPVPGCLYTYTDSVPDGFSVCLNGELVDADVQPDGYVSIKRKWKKGDNVDIAFEMRPRFVESHKRVAANRGRVAVERGPVVYCAEWPDNDFDIHSVLLNTKRELKPEKSDKLCGITQLKTQAQSFGRDADGDITVSDVDLILIPYYAWAHRGEGNMSVWLPVRPSALPE